MTQAEASSLITDEMRAIVGKRSEPTAFEVDKLQVRMFARSVGHIDPIYYDEAEARKAATEPALPSRLPRDTCLRPSQQRPDFGGARPGPGPQPARPLRRVLNGGTEIEYFGDICAGDVLKGVSYTADIQERSGSLGEMLITTSKTEYTNQNGELVAISTGTGIRY
jgi:hypothetical protein